MTDVADQNMRSLRSADPSKLWALGLIIVPPNSMFILPDNLKYISISIMQKKAKLSEPAR
jgi:hypothetical protein